MNAHPENHTPCCRFQTWTLIDDDQVAQVWVPACPTHGHAVGSEVRVLYPARDEVSQEPRATKRRPSGTYRIATR